MTIKKTQSKKSFDCLAYKDAVQSEIQAELEGKSYDEQRALLKQWAEQGPLGEWWKMIAAQKSVDAVAAAVDPTQPGHF